MLLGLVITALWRVVDVREDLESRMLALEVAARDFDRRVDRIESSVHRMRPAAEPEE